MNAENGWIIDVCVTCHRQAKWPFCEHRPVGLLPADSSWCIPVHVKPTRAGLSALRAASEPTQGEDRPGA